MASVPQNAQAVSQKWQRNFAGSSESYKARIGAVTESPMEKAAAAKAQWVAGVNRASENGKYEAGLRRVSLQQWKDAAMTKGAQRLADGAAAARPKMEAFLREFLPFVAENQRRIADMPRGSLEQNIARAAEMMRLNAQFRRS